MCVGVGICEQPLTASYSAQDRFLPNAEYTKLHASSATVPVDGTTSTGPRRARCHQRGEGERTPSRLIHPSSVAQPPPPEPLTNDDGNIPNAATLPNVHRLVRQLAGFWQGEGQGERTAGTSSCGLWWGLGPRRGG